jgi:hypothetical protein
MNDLIAWVRRHWKVFLARRKLQRVYRFQIRSGTVHIRPFVLQATCEIDPEVLAEPAVQKCFEETLRKCKQHSMSYVRSRTRLADHWLRL